MAWVITFLENGWTVQWMSWKGFLKAVTEEDHKVVRDFSEVKLS